MRKLIVLFVFVIVESIDSASLPSDLKKCALDDPNLSECLNGAIQEAVKFFKDGYKPLRVIPLDPLPVNTLEIGPGPSVVKVDQVYHNAKVLGLSNLRVFNSSVSENGTRLDFSFCFKDNNVVMTGDYDMAGEVLFIPFTGRGKFNVTLVEPTTNNTLTVKNVERDGDLYGEMQDYKFTFRPKRVIFEFDGLFDGDKALSDNLLKTMNENWEKIYDEIGGAYGEAFGLIFKDITSQILNRVPRKELAAKSAV